MTEAKTQFTMIKWAQSYLDFAKHIPIVPLSALNGDGIWGLMKMISAVYKENQKRIGRFQ